MFGEANTVRTAVAGPNAPAKEVIKPVLFVYVLVVAATGTVIFTVNEQLPFAGMVPPVSFTALSPAPKVPPAPSVTVPPQVLVAPGGFAISMVDVADGSVSVKATFVIAVVALGLVSVMVIRDERPAQFELGLNDFVTVGLTITVTGAVFPVAAAARFAAVAVAKLL